MILEGEHEGEYAHFTEKNVTPAGASRFAAQHAKSVINEMVRNSSRRQIYDEFKDRIGELITGSVLQTTPEFAFIKIREGVEAELPDLSWTKKIKHPSEFTQLGSDIDVVVLEIDKENSRLSLGHKQLEENPWEVFETKIGRAHV